MEIRRVLSSPAADPAADRTLRDAITPGIGAAAQLTSQPSGEAGQWEPETLDKAVGRLNETARIFGRTFRFYVDEEADRIVVQIIDTLTGEVIGQVPPEEVLRVAAGIREFLGLLVDRRA